MQPVPQRADASTVSYHSGGDIVVHLRGDDLQSSESPPLSNGFPPAHSDHWQWMIRLATRYAIWLLFMIVAGAAIGVVFTRMQTPVFRSRANIEFQGLNDNFLNIKDVTPLSQISTPTEAYIQTQIEILESRTLIRNTLAKLEQEHKIPNWPAMEVTHGAERQNARVGAAAFIRSLLGLPMPPQLTLMDKLERSVRGGLQFRPNRQTHTVEILFDSSDRIFTAEFPNALVSEFVNHTVQDHLQATQRTSELLREQLEALKVKIARSGQALQDYAGKTGLLFTGEKNSVAEEKLRELQAALSVAEADRVAKQAQVEAAAIIAPSAATDTVDSPTLSEYRSKLTELERQRAELSTLLTPENYKVKRVQAQIDELRSALNRERAMIQSRIRTEYETAMRKERMLSQAYIAQAKLLSDSAAKTVQYDILKREADTNRQFYDTILQKLKEASVATALQATNLRLIDPATPAEIPFRPNVQLNLTVGALSGFLFGIVIVFVRERADDTLKAPGDAFSYLSVAELGAIPMLPVTRRQRLISASRRRVDLNLDDTGARRQTAGELSIWNYGHCLATDSFRAVLISLLYRDGERSRVILVSSASTREGKTTVVANLGVALASMGRRVLVVDGDLRKPHLHKLFGVPNNTGLCELLRTHHSGGALAVSEVVLKTSFNGLSILPNGTADADDCDLFQSRALRNVLEQLRQEYDYVLIDSSPLLMIPDARVLARLADAAVLVLRAGHTTRSIAARAIHCVMTDRTPLLGAILNGWNPAKNGSEYSDKYYEPAREKKTVPVRS